jgi:hypothetical protein
MRLLCYTFIFLFLNLSFSQKFEKGYFIENNGNKVECFLDKKYQFYSPDIVKYKLLENDNIKEIGLNSIKELSIYNKVIYYKFNVELEVSGVGIEDLNNEKKLNTITKNVLLELVEDGKIKLFVYNFDYKSCFYLLKEGESVPELLDYKKYRSGEQFVAVSENNDYRNEIYNFVKDANISAAELENIEYEEDDLQKVIKRYNEFNNNSLSLNIKKSKSSKLNIKPRLSILNSSVEYQNLINSSFNSKSKFDSKVGLGFGIDLELETISNFSVFLSPIFSSYTNTSTQTIYGVSSNDRVIETKVDYKFIRNLIGVRKYFELKNKKEIYLGANLIFDYVLNSETLQVFHPDLINLNSNFQLGLNLGFDINKRYYIEFNYDLPKNLSSNTTGRETKYNNISFSVMYNLFNKSK